jgi:ABC-type uncharacterized transport system substrate-binding protein
MRKVFFLSLIINFVWLPLAEAQPSSHHPRVGFLALGVPAFASELLNAFHEGLRELGYMEGKNVFIEYRYGHPGRSQEFAEELVRLEVNVIVATSTPSIKAAKQATSKIPVVMVSASDPVPRFVDTLARPGGNITGVSGVASQLSGKLLGLITQTVPKTSRVGVLRHPLTPADSLKETEFAARAMKRELQIVQVRSPSNFDEAMLAFYENHGRGLVVLPTVLFARNAKRIAELAIKYRLATIFWLSRFAKQVG